MHHPSPMLPGESMRGERPRSWQKAARQRAICRSIIIGSYCDSRPICSGASLANHLCSAPIAPVTW